MRHLFTRDGRDAIEHLLARQPLLAFDFDGTLAPIVARPADARVSATVSRLLARLQAWRPVAIVTGRSIEDVTPRLGFEPAWVVGSHGAEGLPGEASRADALDAARALICQHAVRLSALGVDVEDKAGSLALHYRLSPDRAAAREAIDAVAAGFGASLRVFGGKFVVNVAPADAPDKGDAVTRLLATTDSDCALFVGDDLNDEAVFRIAAEDWLTVRVGRDDPASMACWFLESHAEVAQLLARLVEGAERRLPR